MFHYVDLNEENMSKMTTFKKLRQKNLSDRGLGTTFPVAEKIDNLLKACEDIETQANIVQKSLDQTLLRGSSVAQDNIYRLYVVLRQGLKILTTTTFRQVPKSDIKNLTDYRDTLTVLYTNINDAFLKINEIFYGNEPLNKRTIEEYKQQTGSDYRTPVPAQRLQEFLTKKGEKETIFNEELRKMRQSFSEIQRDLSKLEERIDTREQQIYGLQQQIDYEEAGFNRLKAEYERTPQSARKTELSRIMDGSIRSIQKLYRDIERYTSEKAEYEEQMQILPKELEKLEKNIKKEEIGLTGEYKSVTLPLTQEEYELQAKAETNSQLAEKDFSLIMKIFDTFINTLNHGLTSYTTGISGRFNTSQESNYRTPVDTVIKNLEGSGRNTKIHKRFL
jgi:predicted  nucleic acid-binding Zn-ribbon protein